MRKRVAEASATASLLLLTGCSGPLSTLDPAGPHARDVAWLWWGMFAFSVVVMIFVCVLWWVAMRRAGDDAGQKQAQHLQNRWIIWGGIGLPTAAITLLLAFGIPAGHRMMPLPDDNAVVIEIEAHQWFWRVTYPELDIELIDEIHIPAGRPVHFHIRSEDVIHSFWVPRLGGKVDAIPGRTNVLRLEADEAGEYRGQCAEYCGTAHAFMDFVVHAHDEADYEHWQQQMQGERDQ